MIISIDKYKKTGGGSSGGSNTGGNSGNSNTTQKTLSGNELAIFNIIKSYNFAWWSTSDILKDVQQQGIANLLSSEIYLLNPIPKIHYNYNSSTFEKCYDGNGNELRTYLFPEDYWYYMGYQKSMSPKVLKDECKSYLRENSHWTRDVRLTDENVMYYQTNDEGNYLNSSPYMVETIIKNGEVAYGSLNDIYYSYDAPDSLYSIDAYPNACLIEKYDINNCYIGETSTTNGKMSNVFGSGTTEDTDIVVVRLGDASTDGKYDCYYDAFKAGEVNPKKYLYFIDNDNNLLNYNLNLVFTTSSYDSMPPLANMPMTSYKVDYIVEDSYHPLLADKPIFGPGLTELNISLKSFKKSAGSYNYNTYMCNNASDLKKVTINIEDSYDLTINDSDVLGFFEKYLLASSGTEIFEFNCSRPIEVKYNNFFHDANKLKTINGFDNITITESTNSMFYNCSSLTSIPALDTSNVVQMGNMFYNCSSLTSIPALDTSNVTGMAGMFNGCKLLTSIPALDTSNVTSMNGMFQGCSSLTSIPQLDTSKVTDMSWMFYNCSSLTSIPALDTSNVTGMAGMFNGCKLLTSIPALDTSKVTYAGDIIGYNGIKTLTDLGGFKNLSVSIASGFLENCPNVTVESLMNVINNLATVSGKSLSFGSTNLNKLTAEQIAIATAKGWTLTA